MSKKSVSKSSANSSISNSKKGEKTMSKKSVSKSSAISSTFSKNGEKTMSKKSVSKSSANDALLAQILELLGKNEVSEASEEKAAPKSEKAERTYEFPGLSGSFSKELFARPLTEEAGKIHAACDSIRKMILARCTAPIARTLAGVKDFEGIKLLLSRWSIPARALRTVLQLVSPIVCVSCDDTRALAHMYDMDKANALMGSVCNSFMYEKITDKAQAIPFKRVCYNFTTLGLGIGQEWDGDSVVECAKLCDMWLSQCKAAIVKKTLHKDSGNIPAQRSDKPAIDKSALMAMIEQLLNN